jgi:hypothetical protein
MVIFEGHLDNWVFFKECIKLNLKQMWSENNLTHLAIGKISVVIFEHRNYHWQQRNEANN